VNNAVYDAGALIAADRNDRSMWAEHRIRLEEGIIPRVPAPVVGQVSRSGRQAQLRRLLRGCDVVDFTEDDAHRVGRVLHGSKTSDVVDGAVVVLALAHDAEIVTADHDDIARLLTAGRANLPIVEV
jgi:hypothetical protein